MVCRKIMNFLTIFAMTDHAAHEKLLCCLLQLRAIYQTVVSKAKNVGNKMNLVKCKESQRQKTESFKVNSKVGDYVRDPAMSHIGLQ